jgi:hypothetical protein
MAVDSFSQPSSNALDDLDPLSRALLDLSVKRGMSDEEIAGILGTDSDSVLENRVALLRSLAEQVAPESADADLPELQAAVADRLYGDPEPEIQAPEEPVAYDEPVEPAASVEPQPMAAAPASKRRSPFAVLLPLLILVALVAGIVLIASGGGDDSGEPAGERPESSAPDQPAKAEPQRARLTALGGGNARGTATVDGNRLRLRVTGLPKDGRYQVWLYDSIIDARSLGRLSADGTLRATLPANAGEFKYVDVSREPADANPNHSGQSVLRVPTRELR